MALPFEFALIACGRDKASRSCLSIALIDLPPAVRDGHKRPGLAGFEDGGAVRAEAFGGGSVSADDV